MQPLHKAISDLPMNRGINVYEIPAAYTSVTCPKCNHNDKSNRSEDDRTKFKCKKCGIELDADIDVATFNIEKVALTGQAMPKANKDKVKAKAKVKTITKMAEEISASSEMVGKSPAPLAIAK